MAYAFEQRTKVRDKIQPYVVPKTELADVVGKSISSIIMSPQTWVLQVRLASAAMPVFSRIERIVKYYYQAYGQA